MKNFYLENYLHEFDIRHKKTGGGVSLFLTSNMIYCRRNDIIFNYEINSVTVDIEKREINGHSNISLILVYRPLPTQIVPCSLMIWKEILQFYLQRTGTYFYLGTLTQIHSKVLRSKPIKLMLKILLTYLLALICLNSYINQHESSRLLLPY